MNLCGCELPVGNLTGKINYVSGFELTMTGMNSLAAINIVPCEIQPLLDINSRSPGTTSCVGQVREQNAPHRQLLARWSLRPVPASWTTFDRSVSLGRLLLLLLLLLWIWLFPRLLAMASTGFCGRRSVNVRHHYQTQFRICLHSAATAQRVNGVKTWPRFSSVQFGTVQYGMVRLEFAWIEESQQLSRSEWLEGQCGTRCWHILMHISWPRWGLQSRLISSPKAA